MKRIYKYLFRKEAGFALVEIMVVIIVMSVLSGVAVPSYMTIKNRASESGTESDMKGIAAALELYSVYNDRYPFSGEGTEALEDKGYIKNISENDLWENQYNYNSDGDGYTYRSFGIDGENGTEDDIVFKNGTMIADGAYGDLPGEGNGSGKPKPPVVKDPIVSKKIDKVKKDSIGYGALKK
ncbi:MAG: type II secretion system GspH family protein [Actinomycetia bacterium]|nr:type II secretion system GspH family protein [Actinomycetes bacterium]